jgi:hypothetical protein
LPKRRARRSAARPGDILAPAPERHQHGPIERVERAIADSAGRPAQPYRAVDTLAVMHRRGSITGGMRQAGEQFRALFRIASFDPLHAAALVRIPTGRSDPVNERVLAARQRVWRAICAVGGLASPGGSCLWHVIGVERTLKQWALEQGWNGRRLTEERSSGILTSALGTLEEHFFGARSE